MIPHEAIVRALQNLKEARALHDELRKRGWVTKSFDEALADIICGERTAPKDQPTDYGVHT